jgi:hypothetical protein
LLRYARNDEVDHGFHRYILFGNLPLVPADSTPTACARARKTGVMHHCCPVKRAHNLVQFPQDTPHPCACPFSLARRKSRKRRLKLFYFKACFMQPGMIVPTGLNIADVAGT